MDEDFINASKRYEARRQAAREATHISMHNKAANMEAPLECLGLDVIGITDFAIQATVGWTLPWATIVGQSRPYVRRFEVAFWYRGTLYGLAVGRASRGKDNVCIHYMERKSGDNPFAGWVAFMVADAADNFAKLVGCHRVKIRNPTDQAVRRYQAIGFSLAVPIRGATYYERRVS